MGRKLINILGYKFGRLNVIRKANNNKWGNGMWLCKCDCGNEIIVQGSCLRNSNTRSCGCLKKEKMSLDVGLASMRKMIRHYKSNAKKQGREYKLTDKQFYELTQKDCYYCGAEPNNISRDGRHNGDYIYNGLDRINNDLGYLINNVVPCCKVCNIAKHQLTLQEFKNWVKRVYSKFYHDSRDRDKEIK